MYIKEKIDICKDFINKNRSHIIKITIISVSTIILLKVFILSGEVFSIKKEANIIIENIEKRNYVVAIENYEKYEKEFSNSKMEKLNKDISKKISIFLLDLGDGFIEKQVTKEQFTGIVNTVNMLENLEINIEGVIQQSQRVLDMYKSDNIDYEISKDYMNIVSSLEELNSELDIYKVQLNEIKQLRELYEQANDLEESKNYNEAIEKYKKITNIDERIYNKAQENIKICIDEMYDYYIKKAKSSSKQADYEQALVYVEYLKKYYKYDETVLELEAQYKESISLYTLSTDDIKNLITSRSDKKIESLVVDSYRFISNGKNYYQADVYEYDILVNILLIDPVDRIMYSYNDSEIYFEESSYTTGYFRAIENDEIEIASSIDKSKFILKNKLNEINHNYKDIYTVSRSSAQKHMQSKNNLNQILKNESHMYHYFEIKKGWFRSKELFAVNMYTQQIHQVENGAIINY